MIPEPIKHFAKLFSELPSIGPRQAMRLAYQVASLSRDSQSKLVQALDNLKDINRCPECLTFKPANTALCSICSDQQRNKDAILIVEKETDLNSLENNHLWAGTYFIFGPLPERGQLSDRHEIRIRVLKNRLKKLPSGRASEIVLALPHSRHGIFVTNALKNELRDLTVKISELARGLPSGADIEFADTDTLKSALDFRI